MFERLEAIVRRYEALEAELTDPSVLADPARYQKLAKEAAELEPTVAAYRAYRDLVARREETRTLLEAADDDAWRELVKEELSAIEDALERAEAELRNLLVPKDPNDDKNVILEIRGAAGGEEAALFAADLFRMYSRYAEAKGWKVDVLDAHYTDLGGIKEIVCLIQGRGAYSRLKFESGAHRVQRVPVTESGGRIHTSTATVAVLPEVEDVDVEIHEKDLRIDTFASSGPGGQSVNTTMSAVRITHLPTGIVVSVQDERSQHRNKEKAMKILRARLYERMRTEQEAELAKTRKAAVGTGERSERIRTYNFPQNRVTDHRIGLTLHRLDAVLEGELDLIIEPLLLHERAAKLSAMEGA
ncbi:MAG: peptide chain release factor 1 [Hydrogenibacillus schlegelii]|nr:peptide chain release factor 1 [Hydrogenibacillus schlegelii]